MNCDTLCSGSGFWAGSDLLHLIGRAAIIRQTTYPTRVRVHTGECAMPLAPHGPTTEGML